MKVRATCMAILLCIPLLSCDTIKRALPMPAQRPKDFSLRYEYYGATVPPPNHYEYTISIDEDGHGKINFRFDYALPEEQGVTETFDVSPSDLDHLYQVMLEQGMWSTDWQTMKDPPTGSGCEWVIVTTNQRKVEIPEFISTEQQEKVDGIFTAIFALIPQSIKERYDLLNEHYR